MLPAPLARDRSDPRERLAARPPFAPFDAERRFPAPPAPAAVASPCRSGDVLRGAIRPTECPAFGRACTPHTPLGPTMVSGEGACAAYHAAGRTAEGAAP